MISSYYFVSLHAYAVISCWWTNSLFPNLFRLAAPYRREIVCFKLWWHFEYIFLWYIEKCINILARLSIVNGTPGCHAPFWNTGLTQQNRLVKYKNGAKIHYGAKLKLCSEVLQKLVFEKGLVQQCEQIVIDSKLKTYRFKFSINTASQFCIQIRICGVVGSFTEIKTYVSEYLISIPKWGWRSKDTNRLQKV